MKLVMTYDVTDGCTYHDTFHRPIVVPDNVTIDELEVEFLEAAEKASDNYEDIVFYGRMFDRHNFFHKGDYVGPKFWTVDRWFDYYNR